MKADENQIVKITSIDFLIQRITNEMTNRNTEKEPSKRLIIGKIQIKTRRKHLAGTESKKSLKGTCIG